MRFLLCLFCFLYPVNGIAAEMHSVQSKDVVVVFEDPLGKIAEEVTKAYPVVKEELAGTVGWKVDFIPEIVLVKDRYSFRKAAGSDLVVAFAVPDENLMVLDTSRVYARPFSLGTTLRHELCHLLLHRNIGRERLPRWLDEGFCQWASGGIAELSDDTENYLSKAVMSGRLMDMGELKSFPRDERSMRLAYQESKSLVEYVVNEFGSQNILRLLEYLKEGDSVSEAVQKSLSVSLSDLENKWHRHLKRKYTLFYYLSSNIYTIIFSFAAIVTIYGFFRLIQKKRAYVDEDEEDGR